MGTMSPDIGARTRNHQEQSPFVSHNKFRTTQARTTSSAGATMPMCRPGEVTFIGVLDAVSVSVANPVVQELSPAASRSAIACCRSRPERSIGFPSVDSLLLAYLDAVSNPEGSEQPGR